LLSSPKYGWGIREKAYPGKKHPVNTAFGIYFFLSSTSEIIWVFLFSFLCLPSSRLLPRTDHFGLHARLPPQIFISATQHGYIWAGVASLYIHGDSDLIDPSVKYLFRAEEIHYEPRGDKKMNSEVKYQHRFCPVPSVWTKENRFDSCGHAVYCKADYASTL
jgi:hypothetical protein